MSDPKPEPRYRADQGEWIVLRTAKLEGRLCRCGCGRSATELHHLVPKSLGGPDKVDNVVGLCRECHDKVQQLKLPQCAALRANLSEAEIRFVTRLKGRYFLTRYLTTETVA